MRDVLVCDNSFSHYGSTVSTKHQAPKTSPHTNTQKKKKKLTTKLPMYDVLE